MVWSAKRIAVIGASRNKKEYSRSLFQELLKHGYDAIPVNPNADKLDGKKCHKNISSDITEKITTDKIPRKIAYKLCKYGPEQMPSIFIDKSVPPNDKMLAEALGKSARHWMTIKAHLSERCGEWTEEWKYYNPKSGWVMKVLRKKRNLFFFFPSGSYFTIAFVFGDKAASAAEKSDLPADLKESLRSARKYAEGKGIRIDTKTAEDVENIKTLIEIKIGH